MAVGRGLRRKVRPYFLEAGWLKRMYDGACIVCVMLVANYLAMPFQLLSLELGLRCWSEVYFCGHIVLLVLFAALRMLPTPKPAAPPAAKKTN